MANPLEPTSPRKVWPGARPDDAPTRVRYRVLFVTTLAAVVLYLDRNCLAEVLKYDDVKRSLGLDKDWQVAWSLSAFYWTYAVAQVPTGWLGDRFGARTMMVVYIAGWSACTALMGWATGFAMLCVFRLSTGAAQAGAYPTSGALLSRWMPLAERGLASSVVAWGGRVGGAIAPDLTTRLMLSFGNWQGVMLSYGVLGLGVSGLFWLVFRERPERHPRSNAAERRLIAAGRPASGDSPPLRTGLPFAPLIASSSMWLMCVSQFTTNVGWVFLVTWLPSYLKEAKRMPDAAGGRMTTWVLFAGMAGMLLGGYLTDRATRALGLRWGRSLPLVLSRFMAAAAFMVVPWLDSPLAVAAAFAVVAFSTDLGVAGTWAYMQDVGGGHVGSVLGWGNMWGNFGAAVSPPLLEWVNRGQGQVPNWNIGFAVCAISFVISGLASLGIDATKPIVPDHANL
ncbi:MAG TPA: MFS transporter [Pirellulales bacterium]|nr:MFS transporter [Pirellulales bacterium]